ncbi:ankyrin repeat domain-containing protein [Wolbachia endosymbiont of Tettigetta isshikii]|uniref:ankyrin repeat domain-containing protein n=1 Tax=Wolbachia endosymbiont of Tettigetta isshikii TaxID=3239093 RepID=UPI00397F0D49
MPSIGDNSLDSRVPEPYRSNRTNITNNNMFGRTTLEPLSASTKKLFQAIDDETLEDFKRASVEGVDVNAFDEGYTPLMTIVTVLSTCSMETEKKYHSMLRLLLLDQNINVNIHEQTNGNTVLHLAMCYQQKGTLQLLLSHPDINTNITNKKNQSPSEYATKNRAGYCIIEIQKAQKGKKLLNALANGDIYKAETLLNQKLNPNCWRRNQNGEIETPLSLIVGLCSGGITKNKKEVLTKLLKHKELDFSQIKPIQNKELKLLVELTIKNQLTNVINRKDLDDVKKLVEDNCFMNYAIVAAALRDVGDPIESITNYLNEKFPVSMGQSLSEGFKQPFQDIGTELESVQADLKQAKREKVDQQAKITRLINENAQLGAQNQDLKNKKSSGEGAPGGKQNNYALAFFILPGTFVVGACLTAVDYPEISAGLAAVVLGLFLAGYFLYKGDEKDIGPGSATDNPQVKRISISSPNSAGSSCTY